jgi:hypothetical protein
MPLFVSTRWRFPQGDGIRQVGTWVHWPVADNLPLHIRRGQRMRECAFDHGYVPIHGVRDYRYISGYELYACRYRCADGQEPDIHVGLGFSCDFTLALVSIVPGTRVFTEFRIFLSRSFPLRRNSSSASFFGRLTSS